MSTTVDELAGLELFSDCDPDDLIDVAQAITAIRKFSEGEVVCREGEAADCWWIVTEGMADATSGGLYLATIGAGETIGELALLDGQPRTATVTATTDMVLHEVQGDGFLEALRKSPNLGIVLLRELAGRLRAANQRNAAPRPVSARPVPLPATAAPAVDATQLDPRAEGFFDDPYAQLAALRERAPVHWSDVANSFVITRYEHVHPLTRDRALIGSVGTTDPEAALAGVPSAAAVRRRLSKSMLRRDGEEHLRLRRLVSKVFTPRAITLWRERTETVVDTLLDEAADKGKIDVMPEFALRLPVQIISEMLGMPYADVPQLKAWSDTITRALDPDITPAEDDAATTAGWAFFDYIGQVVADKRSAPADDILTRLIEAEEEGDTLTTEEIQAQVMLLYVAGHETTANLIGNGLTHLFRFPDQLDVIRTDPSLDANTVEEALRFDSPAQFTRRVNREEIEVGGTVIPAGSLITLALGSANRDPRKWGPTADVLDVARTGANEHTSFGGGAHFCLGNALARLETQVALPRLVRRFPRIEPAYVEPTWLHRTTLRGVAALPVTLGT
jgi:cytochrome P450